MQNYVDTNLKLLQQESAAEGDYAAPPFKLEFAALAPMNRSEVRTAWNASHPQSLVAGNVDVFMVEDDPSMITLVRTLLRAESIDLLAAGSFYEAMRVLRQIPPHLLLVDLSLPDGSGLDIARIVRGWTCFPQIPIVALTASSEKAGRAWQAGFSGFISKPFDPMTFRSMVRSWLSASLTQN